MQICRRAYDVKDKESDIELEVDNKYIMSPKDLKTIHLWMNDRGWCACLQDRRACPWT